MSLRDLIVPDEIQSAAAAAADMLSIVKRTSHFWLKQFVGAALPIAAGFSIGWWFADGMTLEQVKTAKEVVSAIMTIASVLAGFMVTLMLFTGRTSGTKGLTVEQAPEYVAKITYLLFSQALTLVVHILCILACLAWLAVYSLGVSELPATLLFSGCTGLMLLSMIRTLLLPFQIYEVHEFELSAMVDEKKREFRATLDREL